MIILLSPAKTLDYSKDFNFQPSVPTFLNDSSKLVKGLKSKEPKDIASLMSLSDKLATLNFERFQSWSAAKKIGADAKHALFVFKGDVYQGLQAEDFSEGDVNFAQKHLRILSGLYGELRPLDLIKPYRLEMGTKYKNERGDNLYQFWGDKIQKNILKELKDSPVFKDAKNGEYKLISFYAKKARGFMSNWIIKNRVKKAADLKNFNEEGYYYSKKLSTDSEPVFLRD